MSVDVIVRHSVGRLRLDLDIRVGHGLTALVGPSGSGKTTLLNIIAGLVRPEHAVIRIGDEVLADTAEAKLAIRFLKGQRMCRRRFPFEKISMEACLPARVRLRAN